MSLINAVIRRAYRDKLYPTRKLAKKPIDVIRTLAHNLRTYLAKHEILAWFLRILLTAAIAAVIYALIHWYNDCSRALTRAEAYFAQVGVELKRRGNLIPNLVAATGKYVLHEEEVFKYVSDAREMFVQAKDVKQKVEAAARLETALSKLLAVVENYPELKATQSVQDLIKELSNTENRIAEQKGKYNEEARKYNQILSSFPTNILGRLYGFTRRMPYIAGEKDMLGTPEVELEWKEDFKDE